MPRTVMTAPVKYVNRNPEFTWLFIPRTAVGRTAPGVTIPGGNLTLTAALLAETSTVEFTAGVESQSGFTKQQGDIPTRVVNSLEVGNLPGEVTYPESQIVGYLDELGTNDIRAVLPEGASGYLVLGRKGVAATDKVNIYQVRVKSHADVWEDAARVTVPISVDNVQRDVTVPS